VKARVLGVLLSGLLWFAAGPALAADSGVMSTDTVVDPTATVGPAVEDPNPTGAGDRTDFRDDDVGDREQEVSGENAPAADPENEDPGDVDNSGGSQQSPGSGTPVVRMEARRARAIRTDPGYSNAAKQTVADKRDEAKKDCVPSRPPISKLLGVQGSVVGDERRSWVTVALLVALSSVAVAGAAYWLRRRRAAADDAEVKPRGLLEQVATVVAIFGGLVGLAGELGARLGAEAPPPPEAAMMIREVHPRITRGEYADKTDAKVRLTPEDEREVGNVVWLEIRLKGYRDKRLDVQYGLYDLDAGEALLPATAKKIHLNLEPADVQTLILPIWVGYPLSERFEAQYRLLEDNAVREMTATGVMRGSKYRYACKQDATSSS